jgi:hypothetical protein
MKVVVGDALRGAANNFFKGAKFLCDLISP